MDVLDLDSKESWHPDFQGLVYHPQTWPAIETELGRGKHAPIEFLEQVRCSIEHLRNPLAKQLRDGGQRILFNRHSHIAAYHGCRPVDENSYRKHGLLPSNISALITQAKKLFDGISGFDEALRSIGVDYLEHNHGKIGFLMSAIQAKYDHNEYANGSELIRSLARRLGPEARERFTRIGRPTLIKCAIPLNWLDDYATFRVSTCYVADVIAQLILWRKWPNDEFYGFSGGFLLKRAIPPENILEFIDMTDFVYDN